MKVLHVIPSLSLKHGGPSVALPLMAKSLSALGVTVDIATTDDDGPGGRMRVPLVQPVLGVAGSTYYFRKQTEFYKVSLPLARWLYQRIPDYDLVHVHALFSHTSLAAARAARSRGVPYIIRPLGLLNQWGMEHRRPWLKRLSLRFLEGPVLRHASAMHYTSSEEQQQAEKTGATAAGFVVPLGIDLESSRVEPEVGELCRRFPVLVSRRLILFLSRIDPKKGLDLLIPAFASVRESHPDALLVIAGEGDRSYVTRLKELVNQLGIVEDVVWAGQLSGALKQAALASARIFVLPSYSENFGIALVEALAAGCPCVTTDGVAVASFVKGYDAGIVVPPEVDKLAWGIARMLSDTKYSDRCGVNARRLVMSKFSLEAMGQGLSAAYQKVLGTSHQKPTLAEAHQPGPAGS